MKRIVCIGDSIRGGYEPTVISELAVLAANRSEIRNLRVSPAIMQSDNLLWGISANVEREPGITETANETATV